MQKLGDPFVCQNPRGVCASHSLGETLGCAYNNCLYSQILIYCLSYCIRDLLMYLAIHLLVDFQYFKVRNQPFFVIVLSWSASIWFVFLNIANSVQISIIFISILFLKGYSENNYNASLLSSPDHFLHCGL